ncbi:hypothetical protein RIF29_12414 [Crotalaria pallida]|uniref:Two-component response regulator n=1 Tax=Crotalaria pallida TaxID=3830 RepID=A0AAN9IN46_CROPI
MTVENTMVDPSDQFPIGMRVLAVDDDPTCLFVLETLLRRCQYHVTTTNQAITALTLLRENKDKFDLVISDVHMPDMDGFKLLELVGLEMDLPVIMLSTNGDKKMVMKGISHGACDYLLKPVRIEELKNIWQHVIRRKKFDPKEKNKTNNQDKPTSDSGNGPGSAGNGNSDQNGKQTKKRKDQDEEEDEEQENDNEDPSTQKKPRVVWSVELHRKFVAAVNQLGIEKAVPKKILDMMNVEKLTRENVASHLQKYRLYLKRISCVANQQANMVAALGSTDPSYLRMGSVSGVGHLQTLSGSGQFHNSAFGSFPPSGMISRLNTPSGLNMHGFPPSGVRQLGQSQNLINPTNDQLKFQPAIVPVNQNGIQGMPVSVGLDQLQPNRGLISVQNLTTIDGKTTLPISNKLPDPGPRITTGGSHTSRLGISNNAVMLEAYPQDTLGGIGYENSSSSTLSQHSEVSFSLPDQGRYQHNWSSAVQPSGILTKSHPPNDCFGHTSIPPIDNMASLPLQGGNLGGPSSVTSLCVQSHDSMTDMHSQGVIFNNRPGLVSSNLPFQGWDDHSHGATYHSNAIQSSINSLSPVSGAVASAGHTPRNTDFNFCDPAGTIGNQQKSRQSRFSNNLDSLEDFVSSMMKQEQDKMKLMDGNFICDNYSGGISM